MDWEPTDDGNVRVLNDTADFYRYFDATAQTEFLYGCVQRTVEQDLPEEAAFLERYDAFRSSLDLMFDMPDRLAGSSASCGRTAAGCPAGAGRTNSPR